MSTKIWTRDEIMLRLIQLQVGMSPPPNMPLDEVMKQFRQIAGVNAWRFERGAEFVFTEILALQQALQEEKREKLEWMSRAAKAYEELEQLRKEAVCQP